MCISRAANKQDSALRISESWLSKVAKAHLPLLRASLRRNHQAPSALETSLRKSPSKYRSSKGLCYFLVSNKAVFAPIATTLQSHEQPILPVFASSDPCKLCRKCPLTRTLASWLTENSSDAFIQLCVFLVLPWIASLASGYRLCYLPPACSNVWAPSELARSTDLLLLLLFVLIDHGLLMSAQAQWLSNLGAIVASWGLKNVAHFCVKMSVYYCSLRKYQALVFWVLLVLLYHESFIDQSKLYLGRAFQLSFRALGVRNRHGDLLTASRCPSWIQRICPFAIFKTSEVAAAALFWAFIFLYEVSELVWLVLSFLDCVRVLILLRQSCEGFPLQCV